MKSLTISALAAVLVHAFLFTLNPNWPRPRMVAPQKRTVTITLAPQTAKEHPPIAPKQIDPLPLPQLQSITPLSPVIPQKTIAPRPTPKPKPSVKPKHTPQVVQPPMPLESADRPSETGTPPATLSAPKTAQRDGPEKEDTPVQVSAPLYDHNPKPEYPSLARRRAYEGTVLLKVLVDIQGKAAQVDLLQSSGFEMLDRSAIKTVASWRFEPARRNGRPIAMWVEVPVRYELR